MGLWPSYILTLNRVLPKDSGSGTTFVARRKHRDRAGGRIKPATVESNFLVVLEGAVHVEFGTK